jgi:hypothetical protein
MMKVYKNETCTVAGKKFPSKSKSGAAMPKETKAGKPEKFTKSGGKKATLPKASAATASGSRGKK